MYVDKYQAFFIHFWSRVSSCLLVHAWRGALHVKLLLCVDGDCIDHCVWMVTALIIVCGWWLHWLLFVDGDCVDRCLWMVTALIVVCGWWLRWSLWMVTALIIVCGWWLRWSLWMVTVLIIVDGDCCLAVLRSQACGTQCVRPSPCGATPPGTPSSAATLSATTGRLSWLSLATRKALSCDCLFVSGKKWDGLFVQM